ncbi:sialate O-acetylesterase [uncultured Hymenobacter sp.]|uniref:sialate O-acetylesterase n=1 Tax=uncultured Hymenobacter sp. TaxID=170016 RepID=UPI0035CB6256
MTLKILLGSLLVGLLVISGSRSVQAYVRLPALVGDHMVLQRDQPLPLWGWAAPAEHVTVRFQGRSYPAVASGAGRWEMTLPATPSGGPFAMTITGQNTLTINDILIGDVWLASGQSNMELPLRDPNAPKPGAYPLILNAEQEVAQADFLQIRQFTVKKMSAATPQSELTGYSWQVCSPQTARGFSAVAYFFARDLHQRYRVPVGIISSPWGGTPAEAWVSGVALQSLAAEPLTAGLAGQFPTPPLPAKDPQNTPAALFNGMIAPLIPYALKGVIWYQGESNVGRAGQYRTLFPALIRDWRQRWGQELPFLFVQLANWQPALPQPADSDWARLREAQTAALALPRTGMAVAIDLGDAADIHPANKQDVGHRLALVARSVAYDDQQVVAAGPALKKMQVQGSTVRLDFEQVGSGLVLQVERGVQKTPGGVRGFAVAGADKQFHWATGTLQDQTLVLTSAEVPAPVAVRYNWADNPNGNLYNREGLPAAPFRTDTW